MCVNTALLLNTDIHSTKLLKVTLFDERFFLIFQELKNTQHPVVVLHNASIEDVRAMLAFMYRGQCVVSEDQLPNLLSVAKLLKIQGLCDMKVSESHTNNISAVTLC